MSTSIGPITSFCSRIYQFVEPPLQSIKKIKEAVVSFFCDLATKISNCLCCRKQELKKTEFKKPPAAPPTLPRRTGIPPALTRRFGPQQHVTFTEVAYRELPTDPAAFLQAILAHPLSIPNLDFPSLIIIAAVVTSSPHPEFLKPLATELNYLRDAYSKMTVDEKYAFLQLNSDLAGKVAEIREKLNPPECL